MSGLLFSDEEMPLPAFVKQDPVRSHITVAENPFGQCDGAFVDVGPELHWWAYTSVHLDPTGARKLAEYLGVWAKRAEARQTRVPS